MDTISHTGTAGKATCSINSRSGLLVKGLVVWCKSGGDKKTFLGR